MSKAKLTNECIKKLRAGIPLNLLPEQQEPSSRPDKIAVGRFHTQDGGCHIAKISLRLPSTATRPDGSGPFV